MIPIFDEYDKEVIDIYHIKEDGNKGDRYEAKIEKIDGKKYAIFTTNHFSIYGISSTEKEEVGDLNVLENPKTSDGIRIIIIALIIGFLGMLLTNNYINRKKFSS